MNKNNCSALILGATGATGNYLLKELLASPHFDRVTAITRRPLNEHKKLTNIVWPDFSNTLLTKEITVLDAFNGHEAIFCCLGAPESALLKLFLGSSKARNLFELIDLNCVVAAATAAYNTGTKHISVISSPGADIKSWFSYLKFKGQMEIAVSDLGFDGVSIFKPYHLMKPAKVEHKGCKRLLKNFISWIASIMPAKQKAIKVETLARAMNLEYKKRLNGDSTGNKVYLADDIRNLLDDAI